MYTIELVNTHTIIYDQSVPAVAPILGPKCSLEVNEAGSLTFSLGPTHPQINAIEPLASYVRAYDDGVEIFYGRVISRSKPTLTGNVSFQCAGALSFLMDSEIPPYNKNSRGTYETKKLKAKDFFEWCIEKHNAEVDDARRQFMVGTINAAHKNEEDDYSITSYTQTKSAIESNILNVYGGFIRTRTVNGTNYIDWLEDYPTVDPQAISIGVNLEEQTNETDATSVFTVLRPIGQNGVTLSGSKTMNLYSSADLAKYGKIVKTIQFNSAKNASELQSKANTYKNRIKKTLFESANIRLVDMHYLDGSIPKIRLGDRFTNVIGYSGITMVAASMEIDFEAPQNDTIDMKDRKSLDPDGTQDGHGHGSKSMSGHGNKSQGQFFRWLKEQGDILEVLAPIVNMHGTTLEQHYQYITQTADQYSRISSAVDDINGIVSSQQTKINDMEVTIQTIQGTAVFQNDDWIQNVAGQIDVWKDANGNIKGIYLKNGAQIALDQNGQYINVGERLNQTYTTVNDLTYVVNTEIKGSALWTQRNHIAAVCGQYTVREENVPDPDNPGQTKKKYTLIIESGGGLNVRRNGVELGVWDQGNLTGGVMVRKINGQTEAKISGDKVSIEAKHITIRANETLDSVVGHMRKVSKGPMLDGNGQQMYDPETGEPLVRYELVFEIDGGMRVKRRDDGGVMTEYGVYDNGNLTAGVICGKINGQSYTHIKGSKILVGDGLDAENLPDWCADTEGLITESVTALRGRISTLETDYLQTSQLSAAIAGIVSLGVQNIAASGSMSFKQSNKYIAIGDAVCDIQIVPNGNNYKLQKKTWMSSQYSSGDAQWSDVSTFSRAVAQWQTGWSNGTFTATANPQNQSVSSTLTYLAPVGNVTKNSKIVSRVFKVQYGSDPQNLQDTGFQQSVSISAVDVYNDGWAAARATSLAPSSTNTSDTLTVKVPNATVDGSAVEVSYKVSQDKDYAYIKNGTTTVARVSNTQYSAGWAAARATSLAPSSTNTSDTLTVKVPNATVDGSAVSVTYKVSTDDDYAYIKNGTTTVARVSNSAYSSGYADGEDSVSVSSHYGATYDSNGAGTMVRSIVKLSNDSEHTIYLYLTTSGSYTYVRKNGWNGDAVGKIKSFPSGLTLLNGNQLVMYAASGAPWLNGSAKYWYYSDTKYS